MCLSFYAFKEHLKSVKLIMHASLTLTSFPTCLLAPRSLTRSRWRKEERKIESWRSTERRNQSGRMARVCGRASAPVRPARRARTYVRPCLSPPHLHSRSLACCMGRVSVDAASLSRSYCDINGHTFQTADARRHGKKERPTPCLE